MLNVALQEKGQVQGERERQYQHRLRKAEKEWNLQYQLSSLVDHPIELCYFLEHLSGQRGSL